MELISSRQNPRVQRLSRLLRERSQRQVSGRFVIEGRRECARAVQAGIVPENVYVCPALFREPTDDACLAKKLESVAVGGAFELTREAFEKASGREGPDGVMMTAPLLNQTLEDLEPLPENPLILVLENIEKPGNLGALLRSADAAGVHAVICCNGGVDLHNPNVVRNSQGALFSVKTVCASNTQTAEFLERHNARCILTTPSAATLYWDVSMRGPVALLLGSEKDGLSPFWLQREGSPVRIPMAGGADSLNVSVAAALVLFEAVRQRRS